MFEFSEDKSSIRPMFVGKIKNKYARRVAMIISWPITCFVTTIFNLILFFLSVIILTALKFNQFLVKPCWVMIVKTFSKWEYWDEPRI